MTSSYKWNFVYWLYANPINALWYHFKKAIALLFRRILGALSMAEGIDAEAVEVFAGFFALTLLILAVVFLLYGLYRFFKGRRKKQITRRLFGHEIDSNASYAQFLERGAKSAQKGDYAEAIRAEFVGLLLLLERRSEVHILEAWTTTEIGTALYEVNFKPLGPYRKVAGDFNKWCYGPVPGVEDYSTWHTSLMALWHEVTRDDS